ncbi:hypothetical protein [Sphingopyxis sp.]|uniref:hypothetical protein n=1 Tax=Sphingopyxis sp. TaxID=1908224 RepID=UPI0035B3C4F9
MAESLSSPGIDPPSPTLSARLRELADYLGAPLMGRLTEEQRALSLGIARRLAVDAARTLDEGIDGAKLWADWLGAGLPTAARLAAACFARAEEHRWREYSAMQTSAPDGGEGNTDTARPSPAERAAAIDGVYLALQIADRRRFDDQGHPRIAIADVDADLFRALLRDIAAWRIAHADAEAGATADPETLVERALDRRVSPAGLDRAAADYYAAFDTADAAAEAASAIAGHDWLALIALAAASSRRTYSDMALALVSAEPAALPSLLAPLRLDRASLAPLEASLAALPGRAEEGIR